MSAFAPIFLYQNEFKPKILAQKAYDKTLVMLVKSTRGGTFATHFNVWHVPYDDVAGKVLVEVE